MKRQIEQIEDEGNISTYNRNDFIIKADTEIVKNELMDQLNSNVLQKGIVTDIFSVLEDRFDILKAANDGNIENIQIINEYKRGVEDEIFAKIAGNLLDIDLNAFETVKTTVSLYSEFVKALYEVFVLERYQITVNYFLQIILSNKKEFATSYKKDTKKKDLGVYCKRKTFNNFDDVVILENMEDLLSDILQSEEFNNASEPITLFLKGMEDEYSAAIMLSEFDNISTPKLIPALLAPMINSEITKRNIMHDVIAELANKYFERK